MILGNLLRMGVSLCPSRPPPTHASSPSVLVSACRSTCSGSVGCVFSRFCPLFALPLATAISVLPSLLLPLRQASSPLPSLSLCWCVSSFSFSFSSSSSSSCRCPPLLPWHVEGVIRPIIEKDLGKRVTEVFSSINTVPLASASIAQVYMTCSVDHGARIALDSELTRSGGKGTAVALLWSHRFRDIEVDRDGSGLNCCQD